jgi:hypothetical protein
MAVFASITNALSGVKDRATEASAKAFINRKIQNFGEVTRISIDSKQKAAEIEAVLRGETAPIWLKVRSYQLSERNGEGFIRINGIEASREWIGIALSEYVVGREFPVPKVVRMAL